MLDKEDECFEFWDSKSEDEVVEEDDDDVVVSDMGSEFSRFFWHLLMGLSLSESTLIGVGEELFHRHRPD